MRISTQLLYQRGVNSIEEQQSNLSKTQQQLATGERLRSPADDPFAATRIVSLTEQLSTLDQYIRNADVAETKLNQEETSLTSIINTLQRVREIAVQGANDVLTADDRQALSNEVYQRLEGILQVSNSQDSNGEYIFSGDRTNTVPFSFDGNGNFNYQGDQGQRYIQVGSSRQIAVNDSGYAVFENVRLSEGGTDTVMKIVYDVYDTLNQGESTNPLLTKLTDALEHVSNVRSSIGARMNAIDSEKQAIDSFKLSIEKNKSTLQDLDYAEAISQFQQQLAGLQAAQQTFVQVQGLSLFNYI